jgi:hypothetical protein
MTCVGETLYVAGIGNNHWQVRRSGDGGASWTLIDDGPQSSDAFGIAAGPDGSIYVVGREYRSSTTTVKGKTTTTTVPYWIARKGTGIAGSFTTIAAISNENVKGELSGVTVDPNGNVHITGWHNPASSEDYLLTKRLDINMRLWSTTDRVAGGGGRRIVSDRGGNIYSGNWSWTVRGPQPATAAR